MLAINYNMIISGMPIVREWTPTQELQQELQQELESVQRFPCGEDWDIDFSIKPSIPKLKRCIACPELESPLNISKLVKGGVTAPLEKYLLGDYDEDFTEVTVPELVRGECGCCEELSEEYLLGDYENDSLEVTVPELVRGECGCCQLSEEDILAYNADDFILGKVPEVPPPESMC